MEGNNRSLILMGDSGRIYKSTTKDIRLGITSKLQARIEKGEFKYKHMVLLDFDNYNLSKLITHLKRIKNRHNLPNIYIFKTSSNHFSAMSFKPIKWMYYKYLLFEADVDPNFRYYTLKKKEATLRIQPKQDKPNSSLELVYTIKSLNKEDKQLRESIFNLIGYEKYVK